MPIELFEEEKADRTKTTHETQRQSKHSLLSRTTFSYRLAVTGADSEDNMLQLGCYGVGVKLTEIETIIRILKSISNCICPHMFVYTMKYFDVSE